jgi:hypothetical protein
MQAAAHATDYQQYLAGTLSKRQARDSTAADGAQVPFLPKLPAN